MIFNNIKRVLALLAAGATVAVALAANWSSLPVKNVGGKYYHYYNVQQHETLYALTKRFGVDADELMKLNPSLSDGLKAGQEILIAKADKKTAEKAAGSVASSAAASRTPGNDEYVVKKEETAYGISKRFNLSLDEFYALNPTARDGVREGQVVKIKGRPASAPSVAPSRSAAGRHVIAEHETLYQIARDNGISLTELLNANPGLDAARYQIGTEIVIPAKNTSATEVASQRSSSTATTPSPVAAKLSDDTLRVAVVLPFNAGKGEKHNNTMIEFYRGFLVAVDSLKSTLGAPLKVLTYDTKGTDEGFDQIISIPELKRASVIIGPDNSHHLEVLNEFGNANGIEIVNVFNNRDLSFQLNPNVIQIALPRDEMYVRAARAFFDAFGDYTPVILISNDGRRDKTEFTDLIKVEIGKAGREYKEIAYNGTLDLELLTLNLPGDKKYAFLPASSSRQEFENIEAALTEYKEKREQPSDVVVWGYPEWLANTSNYGKMHTLDSYIYSRTDLPEPYLAEQFNTIYNEWFGPHMLMAYPRRSYIGFDTGMFVLKSLRDNHGDFTKVNPFFPGVTMSIQLSRVNGGGLYNTQLLMINLAPEDIVNKRSI